MIRSTSWRAAILSVALVVLAGCDKLTSIDKNAPPTDAEIFSVFLVYWNQQDGASSVQGMATPVSAVQLNDSVTHDSPYGKQWSVSVRYSFRANADLTYACSGFGQALMVMPAGNPPENSYPNKAKAGDTIECVMPLSFSKIEEGWSGHILLNDVRSYTIRR